MLIDHAEPWQKEMADKLSDAHAAAENRLYDEAAMWAQAALEAWKEGTDDA